MNMSRRWMVGLAGLVLAALPCAGQVAESRAAFDRIMKRVDAGGDMLVVLNARNVLRDAVKEIRQIMELLPAAGEPGLTAARAAMDKLPGFLEAQGFYAADGMGFSVKPRPDGRHDVRSFIARDPAGAALPFWRAITGGEPKPSAALALLPADTALARVCRGDPQAVWSMLRAAVGDFGGEQALGAMDGGLEMLKQGKSVDVPALIGSLGGEGFVAVTLARDATIELPMPQQPLKIARPALLIGQAVKDRTLPDMLDRMVATNGLPVQRTEVEGVTVTTIPLPLPVPLPIQPSYAVMGDFFLFASSGETLADAIRAQAKGNGFKATPDYKQAFGELPESNNGLWFMSPRFMDLMTAIQGVSLVELDATNPEGARAMREYIARHNKGGQSFVVVNHPDGVLWQGISSWGGREMLTSAITAPIGVIAGVALPSLMKARAQAQNNACINNLRQLDAAKEQWALAEGKENEAEPDLQGVLEYIKGNRMPVCPQGGTYQLNAIGTAPTCSHPGHALPW